MDLAEEIKRKGLCVEINEHWIGVCFFADDIILVAEASKELQEMLDLVGRFAKDWKMQFNAKKCGVLVVGEKKKKRLWNLEKTVWRKLRNINTSECGLIGRQMVLTT